jgi:hypothetical protein
MELYGNNMSSNDLFSKYKTTGEYLYEQQCHVPFYANFTEDFNYATNKTKKTIRQTL